MRKWVKKEKEGTRALQAKKYGFVRRRRGGSAPDWTDVCKIDVDIGLYPQRLQGRLTHSIRKLEIMTDIVQSLSL